MAQLTVCTLAACSDRESATSPDGPRTEVRAEAAVSELSGAMSAAAAVPGSCRWNVPDHLDFRGPQYAVQSLMTPCVVPESLAVRISIRGTISVFPNPIANGWGAWSTYSAVGTYGPMGHVTHGAIHSLRTRSLEFPGSPDNHLGANVPPGSSSTDVLFFQGGFARWINGSPQGAQRIFIGRGGIGGERTCPCPAPVGTTMPAVSQYVLSSQLVLHVDPDPQTLVIDRMAPAGNVVEGDSVRLRARSTDGRAVSLRSWTFQPDSGGPAKTICSWVPLECTFQPLVSGVVFVRARIGASGWIVQASHAIAVSTATFKLSVNRWYVAQGKDVNFTATTTSGRPINVTTWIPSAAGQIESGCVAGSASCKWKVLDSLWMVASGTVNGRPKRDSVKVVVVPCPKDDSVLDHPSMRELLRELERRTYLSSPPLEQGGIVMQYPDGRIEIKISPVGPSHTCTSAPVPAPDPPAITLFAAHTHPYRLLDETCERNDDGTPKQYVWGPGPRGSRLIASQNDWELASALGKPHVVLDQTRVMRLNSLHPSQFNTPYMALNPRTGVEEQVWTGPSPEMLRANSTQKNRGNGECVYP